MRVLLDTHTLLWWLSEDPQLSINAQQTLSHRDNTIIVSAASGWEISTKVRIGKLIVPKEIAENLEAIATRYGWETLPINMHHAQRSGLLPGFHKDPFDRVLAAQSLSEGVPLVTNDPAFTKFSVHTIW